MNGLMRCAGIMAVMVCLGANAVAAGEQTASADSAEIRDAVRQVLEQHPEIVLDLLRQHRIEIYEIVRDGLADKREQEESGRIAAQLQNPLVPDLKGDRPFLGPAGAPVVVVAYSDFFCHYCGQAAQTFARLMAEHPKTIRFYHKHHPLNDASREAALYFEALARQDPQLAWQFYELAFTLQPASAEQARAAIEESARGLGADMARLAADLKDPLLAERIRADTAEAERFGFDGTPAVVINGVGLSGARALAQYEQIIKITTGRP